MPADLTPLSIINASRRQTRSVSRSLSSSSTTQLASSEHVKALEEQLKNAQKQINELESEWRTHCHFMSGLVSQLQNQLQAKEKKKGVHAKRTHIESRVLTSEEAHLKEQQLVKETARKVLWFFCTHMIC